MTDKYADIRRLSRPVSTRHLPMSNHDRAAQFAPFAALTGYDDVIGETARLTDGEMLLDVGAEAELDEKIRRIHGDIAAHPQVTVTYFRPDSRKAGGAYITVSGRVKKLEEHSRKLIFTDGTAIALQQIYKIE